MENFWVWLWRCVGILSVLAIAMFVWLYCFVPHPQTVATTYVNSLSALDNENTPLEDATIVLDIQMLKNADNSGQELFELAFSSYQGTNTSAKYTKGVQVVGDFITNHYRSYKTVKNKTFFGLLTYFYLWHDISINNMYSYDISYDKDQGVAYASPTSLNNDSIFVVSVGNGDNLQLAELRFRNQVVNSKYYLNEWAGFYDGWFSNWECYDLVSLNYMVNSIHKSVSSLDAGTHYLTFDLSEFFDIYLQDENGQFNILTQDTRFTYVTAKVNVEDNGISTRNQSIFGMVAENNGSIVFDIDESEKTFWKAQENITIGHECLKTIYSAYYDGYILSIDNATITKLKGYKDLRIHLVVDLSKYENVIGFGSYGLNGLDYYDITILGNGQTFQFMKNSLIDVKLNSIKYSSTLNIFIADDVNIELKAVE